MSDSTQQIRFAQLDSQNEKHERKEELIALMQEQVQEDTYNV